MRPISCQTCVRHYFPNLHWEFICWMCSISSSLDCLASRIWTPSLISCVSATALNMDLNHDCSVATFFLLLSRSLGCWLLMSFHGFVCHLIDGKFCLFSVSTSQLAGSGCASWSVCPHLFSICLKNLLKPELLNSSYEPLLFFLFSAHGQSISKIIMFSLLYTEREIEKW